MMEIGDIRFFAILICDLLINEFFFVKTTKYLIAQLKSLLGLGLSL